MSANGSDRQFAALLAGRWQIPVALAALVTAGATLYHLIPRQRPLDVVAVMGAVATVEQTADPTTAAEALTALLAMQPPLPIPQQAEIHDRLAELAYQQELHRGIHDRARVQALLDQHEDAIRLGCEPSAGRSLRAAQAAEWLGNAARATQLWRAVLDQDPTPPQRREALQGLVRQLDTHGPVGRQRQRYLEELLADEGVSVQCFCTALQEVLQDALDEKDALRARELLEKYGTRLKSSDLRGYWEYLSAWVLVAEGRPEEAAPLVQWTDDWLGTRPLAEREAAGIGDLPALNRWLLGQIRLEQRQPEEALESFDDALGLQPFGELFVAAQAGKARALAQLGRYAAAQEALREAVAKLESTPTISRRQADRLRRRLFETLSGLVQKRIYASPVEYVIATPGELTLDRLALLHELDQGYAQSGDERADESTRRAAHARNGRCLERAAELVRADDARAGALQWLSAQEYSRSDDTADARRMLRRFVGNRPLDPHRPQAMLLLAEACEAGGDFAKAVDWCERVEAEYAQLEERNRAALLRAGCLRELGRDDAAEQTLRRLLADDELAPQAAVFRRALHELCELLSDEGRYGEAIARLEDYATFYPDDPERWDSQFMLADAYRKSAEALRALPAGEADPQQAATESATRLRRAAELYGALSQEIGGTPRHGDAAEYERLALLYRGDCLFELNDPEALRAALDVYAQAASRYERDPTALTAHVQMANAYLRLGEAASAARSIERARRLLASIPESAFASGVDGSNRAQWDRYLSAICATSWFRGAVAAAP